MSIKIINSVLQKDFQKIINENLSFERGNVSGFSIEVFEPDTESYSSYIYYNDEESRDKDWKILCELK
jgi:hypothetical protein